MRQLCSQLIQFIQICETGKKMIVIDVYKTLQENVFVSLPWCATPTNTVGYLESLELESHFDGQIE